MKLFVVLILSCALIYQGFGQSNKFSIRSYNHSLAVSLGKNWASSYYTYLDYGGVKQLLKLNQRYLYHGQELDVNLSVYFFPSRTYSFKKINFQQVDPASQFHSPYLFLGADPINHIDKDGNISKSLILYQEEHDFPHSMNPGTADLVEATNAYYVPMSDLVQDRVPNLPEWNGNVFLKGHLGHTSQREILVEASRDKSLIKTGAEEGMQKAFYHPYFSSYLSVYDGEKMGRKLRQLSKKTGVHIKKVIAGGCEGNYAMDAIQYGFSEESKTLGKVGIKTKFYGLRDGSYVKYMGKRTFKSFKYDVFPKHMRYYLTPTKGEHAIPFIDKKDGTKVFKDFRTRRFLWFKKDPYIEGKEVKQLVNGRIPSKIKSFFEKFTVAY